MCKYIPEKTSPTENYTSTRTCDTGRDVNIQLLQRDIRRDGPPVPGRDGFVLNFDGYCYLCGHSGHKADNCSNPNPSVNGNGTGEGAAPESGGDNTGVQVYQYLLAQAN